MFIETRPHVLLGCLHNIISTLSCLKNDKEGLSLGQKAQDDIDSDLNDKDQSRMSFCMFHCHTNDQFRFDVHCSYFRVIH